MRVLSDGVQRITVEEWHCFNILSCGQSKVNYEEIWIIFIFLLYLPCYNKLIPYMVFCSCRYYLKESRGSRRWLIFLEGQYYGLGFFFLWWLQTLCLENWLFFSFFFQQVAGTASTRRTATVDTRPWGGWWARPSGPKQKQVSIISTRVALPVTNPHDEKHSPL